MPPMMSRLLCCFHSASSRRWRSYNSVICAISSGSRFIACRPRLMGSFVRSSVETPSRSHGKPSAGGAAARV